MRKFLIFISLVVSSLTFGQEEVPYDALGAWYNLDGEVLVISRKAEKVVFVRKSATKVLATGDYTNCTEVIKADQNQGIFQKDFIFLLKNK